MFSPFEKDIFVNLLDEACDNLGNAGCNDLPIMVTAENRDDLAAFVTKVHSSGIDDGPEYMLRRLDNTSDGKNLYMNDLIVLEYFKEWVKAS